MKRSLTCLTRFYINIAESIKYKLFSSMASNPLDWTVSQPDWKIMYSIELQTIFYEYWNKNHKIYTILISPGLWPLGANKTYDFSYDIRGMLSITRCDKYKLYIIILFLSTLEILIPKSIIFFFKWISF